MKTITVVGAGLAGSEAVYQLAKRGFAIRWIEMRPKTSTPAHQGDKPAELVCSNSLRSQDVNNAVGLIKEEMANLDSLIIRAAYKSRVPAGTALAVDRDAFSDFIDATLSKLPGIERVSDEVVDVETLNPGYRLSLSSGATLDADILLIATGPLTSDALSKWICKQTGEESLYFYDSIAPIIAADSIDMNKAFYASRYDKDQKEGGDYINCPMSEEQYKEFITDVTTAEQIEVKDFDKAQYFEGCLPIEVMAARGEDTLRYGPMKPVGISNPHDPENRPYAVVQLRQDNLHASLFNMVGFQTRMKYPEQKRIFSKIPGLEKAEFERMGSMHRNTYLCSPKVLHEGFEFKSLPGLHFAGQMTGCEGYVESAATGLYVGLHLAHSLQGKVLESPPTTTALGALVRHILKADPEEYQPMNINFGLFDSIEMRAKKFDRKVHMAKRGIVDFRQWIYDKVLA